MAALPLPHVPTPGEMRALKALAGGPLGYWQWRASLVTYGRLPKRFRTAWAAKLSDAGLIEIVGGNVSLTALGRAAIEGALP